MKRHMHTTSMDWSPNTVKASILNKLSSRFDAFPIKIPESFIVDMDKIF